MYFIAGFGLLMMCLSAVMIFSPNGWSSGIVSFSKKSYFYFFEITSRLIAGLIFVLFSGATLYPDLILGIGYLLIAVSAGLLLIGSDRHRKFAVWPAIKFKNTFRAAGFGSFVFGVFLIYVSTIGVINN